MDPIVDWSYPVRLNPKLRPLYYRMIGSKYVPNNWLANNIREYATKLIGDTYHEMQRRSGHKNATKKLDDIGTNIIKVNNRRTQFQGPKNLLGIGHNGEDRSAAVDLQRSLEKFQKDSVEKFSESFEVV